jgi:hypothetical protein
MKKKLLLSTLTLAIACGMGGHYYIWHKQTNEIANSLERYLGELKNNSEVKISYSDKKITGYPAKSVVVFNNPVIEIHNANHNIIKANALTISSNLLGDSLSANVSGDISYNDGKENYAVESQSGIECKVKADLSITDIINGKAQPKTPEDLLTKLRHFGCNSQKIKLKSENKLVAQSELYGFNINLSNAGENEKMVDFGLQVKDLEVLDTTKMLDYPNAGKQNISVSGGAVIDKLGKKIDFDMREFKITNNLYSIDLPIKVSNEADFKIEHNGVFDFNKNFNESAAIFAKQSIKSFQGSFNKNTSISDEEFEKLLVAALPNVVDYSPIKSFVNLSASQATLSGDIEKLGFETSKFALYAAGKAGMGAIDLLVTCQNCYVFIEKTAELANNLAKLLKETGNYNKEQVILPESVAKIKQIANECDSITGDDVTTWKITQKDGEIYISDKKSSEIMAQLENVIGEALQK